MDSLTPPELGPHRAELYRLPFELLRELGAGVRNVIPSAKLSRGRLDRNRYYIDFDSFSPGTLGESIRIIEERLGMPEPARALLHEELPHFDRVRFLGVGPSHGQMAYRVYLGFTGGERPVERSAVSIDWVPATGQVSRKVYDELRAVPREEEDTHLRRCLGGEGDQDPAGAAGEVFEHVKRILRKAWGALHVTLIRDPEGRRQSVAFNYYRCAFTENKDIRPELDGLAHVFRLDPERYRAWLEATDGLRIIDVATGRDWSGEPFVTVYHGVLAEPLPFDEVGMGVEPWVNTSGERPSLPARSENGHGSMITSHLPCSPNLVFALGTLGVRCSVPGQGRRRLLQSSRARDSRSEILEALARDPSTAGGFRWVVEIGGRVGYVLAPSGAFAGRLERELENWLRRSVSEPHLLAVPGRVEELARLDDGSMVPVIQPIPRGLQYVPLPGALPDGTDAPVLDLGSMVLTRLATEQPNSGRSPRERALNYGVMTLFLQEGGFRGATDIGLELMGFHCHRPAIRVPHREIWVTVVEFRDPVSPGEKAPWSYAVTVDVSEAEPVALTKPRVLRG